MTWSLPKIKPRSPCMGTLLTRARRTVYPPTGRAFAQATSTAKGARALNREPLAMRSAPTSTPPQDHTAPEAQWNRSCGSSREKHTARSELAALHSASLRKPETAEDGPQGGTGTGLQGRRRPQGSPCRHCPWPCRTRPSLKNSQRGDGQGPLCDFKNSIHDQLSSITWRREPS